MQGLGRLSDGPVPFGQTKLIGERFIRGFQPGSAPCFEGRIMDRGVAIGPRISRDWQVITDDPRGNRGIEYVSERVGPEKPRPCAARLAAGMSPQVFDAL